MASNPTIPHKFSSRFSPPNRPAGGRDSAWRSCKRPCGLTTGGLPSTVSPVKALRSPSSSPQPQRNTLMDDPSHILVVDDDEETVTLLREILSKEGYSVETAADGKTALDRISSRW